MMNSVHNEDSSHAVAAAALNRLFELAPRLAGVMERGMAARGLTLARAQVTWLLARKGPMVQREISDAMRVTPRYVTNLVDALETCGWVTRRPHPSDRRATLVELTERGAAVAEQMTRERDSAARELFADLDDRDLAGFLTVIDHVLASLGDTAVVDERSHP